jgi:hypothetical protein
MAGGVRFRDDAGATAANWRTIVAIDIGMGLAVVAAGVVLAVAATGWGWLLVAVGAVQLFFAGGRATRWRRIRRRAGR